MNSDLDQCNGAKVFEDFKSVMEASIDCSSQNVSVISLMGNGLMTIAFEPSCYGCLEELYLNGNELTSLPDELLLCTKLRVLNVIANKLSILPKNFGNLLNLQEFHADENALTELPDSFECLARLRVAELSNNKLRELPSNLQGLVALNTLNVSSNKLSKIPDSLGEIETLTLVDVSNNFIAVLPETCRSKAVIKMLNVECNTLTYLPEWVNGMASIEELITRSNPIEGTPLTSAFGEISVKLRNFDAAGNYMKGTWTWAVLTCNIGLIVVCEIPDHVFPDLCWLCL